MAQCPVCAATIPDDFGLIECPSCGVQLIVHMDGRVESAAAAAPEFSDSQLIGSTAIESAPEAFEFATPEESTLEEPQVEFGEQEESLPLPSPEEIFGEGPSFEDENGAEFSEAEPVSPPEPEVYKPSATASPAPELADIARFGNADSTSVQNGSLRYNLRIVGIDTADVREAFREALTDRKFMWDTDQILRSIRDGEVHIENVTASKAHILVSRLRSMPVQIRWEQYVVQQS